MSLRKMLRNIRKHANYRIGEAPGWLTIDDKTSQLTDVQRAARNAAITGTGVVRIEARDGRQA